MNTVLSRALSLIPIQKPAIARTRSLLFLCIAVTYGFVLSQLPDVHFKDFNNYLVYADGSWLIALRYVDGGVFRILSNEHVWLLINAGLGLFLDPESVVRTIIFFGATSVAWLILRHYPTHFIWLIFFLFLPQVIKNYLIHLRQGAAIAVFLWGWFAIHRSTRWLLLGLTPLIHASFFFILALLAVTWLLRLIRFAPDLKIITYVSVAIAVGLSLGVLAELLGARQGGEYAFERTDVSGFGFLLWAMILGVMLTAGKTWLREHAFESSILFFYLVTYWLIEVTARIFESGLIVLLLAGLSLPGWRRKAFLGIVLGAGALAWVLRIGRPALGFA
jgi:hypothetical protein